VICHIIIINAKAVIVYMGKIDKDFEGLCKSLGVKTEKKKLKLKALLNKYKNNGKKCTKDPYIKEIGREYKSLQELYGRATETLYDNSDERKFSDTLPLGSAHEDCVEIKEYHGIKKGGYVMKRILSRDGLFSSNNKGDIKIFARVDNIFEKNGTVLSIIEVVGAIGNKKLPENGSRLICGEWDLMRSMKKKDCILECI